MNRLTITTQNAIYSLGTNAVASLFEQIPNNEFDAVQLINTDLLALISRMKTHPVGFTDDYKTRLLNGLEAEAGKHCLITDDWVQSSNEIRAKHLMGVVKGINQGLTIGEAIVQSKGKLQPA